MMLLLFAYVKDHVALRGGVGGWGGSSGVLGLTLEQLHAATKDLSSNALRGERVNKVFLLTHRRWSAASSSACFVRQLLSTLNHSHCASLCKRVSPGPAGEISVHSGLLHRNSLASLDFCCVW